MPLSEYSTRAFSSERPSTFDFLPDARILREDTGMFKIVADENTGKIVGIHVLEPVAMMKLYPFTFSSPSLDVTFTVSLEMWWIRDTDWRPLLQEKVPL